VTNSCLYVKERRTLIALGHDWE